MNNLSNAHTAIAVRNTEAAQKPIQSNNRCFQNKESSTNEYVHSKDPLWLHLSMHGGKPSYTSFWRSQSSNFICVPGEETISKAWQDNWGKSKATIKIISQIKNGGKNIEPHI